MSFLHHFIYVFSFLFLFYLYFVSHFLTSMYYLFLVSAFLNWHFYIYIYCFYYHFIMPLPILHFFIIINFDHYPIICFMYSLLFSFLPLCLISAFVFICSTLNFVLLISFDIFYLHFHCYLYFIFSCILISTSFLSLMIFQHLLIISICF